MNIDILNKRVRQVLTQLLQAGVQAGDPALALPRVVKINKDNLWIGKRRYDLRTYNRIVTVGSGKASARMALVLEKLLGSRIENGLVVTKDGHACNTRRIAIREARHPLPDRRGEQAAKEILNLVQRLTAQDLLLVLISGGASSLLPAPANGLSLRDKQKTTDLLLRSGATIQEINAVRKHLSAIKGGRLAAATQATVISLMLSDVVGDDLSAIGSGPTAADPTTYRDARQILQQYRLWSVIPHAVQKHVAKGVRGEVPETPKPRSPLFSRVQNQIIGNNALAVENVAKVAKMLGFGPLVLTTTLTGEAQEAARMFGAIAREIQWTGRPVRRPACVILGGEPTVTVRGTGKGGRAQEFALSSAFEIAGLPKTWIAAFGTDGTDGPTDAAGAVVDGQTLSRARRGHLDAAQALQRHDSYTFFKKLDGHIMSHPTGTNVNDLYLLLML